MHLPKSNGAYQARRILHEAKPERPLSEKNADGYLRFVNSPVSGFKRLTQVGALPHSTLKGIKCVFKLFYIHKYHYRNTVPKYRYRRNRFREVPKYRNRMTRF